MPGTAEQDRELRNVPVSDLLEEISKTIYQYSTQISEATEANREIMVSMQEITSKYKLLVRGMK